MNINMIYGETKQQPTRGCEEGGSGGVGCVVFGLEWTSGGWTGDGKGWERPIRASPPVQGPGVILVMLITAS
jgi:hypothetical protein